MPLGRSTSWFDGDQPRAHERRLPQPLKRVASPDHARSAAGGRPPEEHASASRSHQHTSMDRLPVEVLYDVFVHFLAYAPIIEDERMDIELVLRQPWTSSRPTASTLSHPFARLTPERALGGNVGKTIEKVKKEIVLFEQVAKAFREVVRRFRARILSLNSYLFEACPTSRLIALEGAQHLEIYHTAPRRQSASSINNERRLGELHLQGQLSEEEHEALVEAGMAYDLPEEAEGGDGPPIEHFVREVMALAGATLTSVALEERTLGWLPIILDHLPQRSHQLLSLFVHLDASSPEEDDGGLTESLAECHNLREVSFYNYPEPIDLFSLLAPLEKLLHLQVISTCDQFDADALLPWFAADLESLDLGFVGLTMPQSLAFASQFNETLNFLSLDGMLLPPQPPRKLYAPREPVVTRYPKLEYLMLGVEPAEFRSPRRVFWSDSQAMAEMIEFSPKLERLMLENVLLFEGMDKVEGKDELAKLAPNDDSLRRFDARMAQGSVQALGLRYPPNYTKSRDLERILPRFMEGGQPWVPGSKRALDCARMMERRWPGVDLRSAVL